MAYMEKELQLLLASFCCGIILLTLYNVLRIFRAVIRHSCWAVNLEDLIFWLLSGFGVSLLLFWENDGNIRWYTLAGTAAGMGIAQICSSQVKKGAVKIWKWLKKKEK